MIQKLLLIIMVCAHNSFCFFNNNYETIMIHNPDDPIACYNAGTSVFKTNNFDKAHAYFGAACAHAQELTSVQREQLYYNNGNSCMALKDYKSAIEQYELVLKENPHNQKAQRNLELARKLLEEETQKRDNKSADESDDNARERTEDQQEGQQNRKRDQQDNADNDSKKQPKEQHEDGADKRNQEQKAQNSQKNKRDHVDQHTSSTDNKSQENNNQDTEQMTKSQTEKMQTGNNQETTALTEQEQDLLDKLQELDAQGRKAMIKSAAGQQTVQAHAQQHNW